MSVIQPRFEVKLNTEVTDADLMCQEVDKDKLFLSQFDGEENVVYLTLNDLQLSMSIDELKLAVDMLHQAKENVIKRS